VGACYIFFAIMFVTNGIINGSGHTMVTTIISLVSLWVVRVPVADWLSTRLHSPTGIWYAMAGSFGVSMLVSVAYYLTGHWRRPVARRRAPIPPGPVAAFGEDAGEM
jgi:Na+-driven multidrug efflux pump